MFSKLALFAAATMAVFVAALPSPGGVNKDSGNNSGINGSCNGGSLQCCNSVQSTQSAAVQKEAGILGILADVPLVGNAGLTCSPIDVLGLSGSSCTQQTTCCTGNSFSGLLVLGCSPVNANI